MKRLKRFQECNIFVKLYRRLRYQPYYFITALFYWFKSKFILRSGNEKLVFMITYAEWCSKAEYWYTPEETFEHVRNTIRKDEDKWKKK